MKLLIVKKAVVTIFEKFKTIGKIPFFRKTVEFASSTITSPEAHECFLAATNSSLPVPQRFLRSNT